MIDYYDTKYVLTVTIVNRGFADQVIDAAREAGARGGTIIYARGTGVHEMEKFLNISIQPEKELIFIVVKKSDAKEVTSAIIKASGLKTEGRGISFSLPVTDLVGITSQFDEDEVVEIFQKNSEKDEDTEKEG